MSLNCDHFKGWICYFTKTDFELAFSVEMATPFFVWFEVQWMDGWMFCCWI